MEAQIPTIGVLKTALEELYQLGLVARTEDKNGFYWLTVSGVESMPDLYGEYSGPESDIDFEEEQLLFAEMPFRASIETAIENHRLELVYRGNMQRSDLSSILVDGIRARTAEDALEKLGIPSSNWTTEPSYELFSLAFRRGQPWVFVNW